MLLALAGAAVLLVLLVVSTTVLMQPGQTYMQVQNVPVAQFQNALEDLVKHQGELCSQLRDLQVSHLPRSRCVSAGHA